MKDIVLFILLGLGAGAVIGGIDAVVITYRGSGIINLATGAISMVAAYASGPSSRATSTSRSAPFRRRR